MGVILVFLFLGSVDLCTTAGAQQLSDVSNAPPSIPSAPNVPPQAAAAPNPVDAVTLDQAIYETLHADPKLRAALETIAQAQADLRTSALLPNPTLTVGGFLLPMRTLTVTRPGGPPELDMIASYPIDWFLFGKRAAAMANARLGVDVSAADYADQVRQRVAGTAAAFYDVLEAQAMLTWPARTSTA